MTSTIHTEALSKRFGHTDAVERMNLDVPEGAIFALVGPNGSGKTTTIKLLMNILRPTAGWAQVLGTDSGSLTGRAFEHIGYVSENQEMPEWMTVAELLAYCRGLYSHWDQQLERQLVRQLDLPFERKLKQLSRGMKMKAAFASSLAYRPSMIVLDEPFSGLDPLVRDELIEGLLERAPESTIFISSHDLAEIESFASHVGYLEQGRLLFSEEMSALNGRFREVIVTLDSPSHLPQNIPAAWLQVQAADCVIRFVHSDFKGEITRRELAERFPAVRDIAFDPMSLRSIFLAVAKSRRDENLNAHGQTETGKDTA
jgi:ABC-2 type transport system ATP-binding protein